MTSEVVDAFAAVTQAGPPFGAVRHRPVGDGPSGVHVGMTPDGTRVLIVEVSDDAPSRDDTSSKGVHLLAAPAFGDGRVYVLECRDPALDGVFTQLAGELVEELRTTDVGGRWRLLRRRLDQWRDLFSPASRARKMSREEQVGLWGELVVLRRRVAAGAEDVLESWEAGLGRAGPDLRWPGTVVEVKTTTALEGFDLHINGLAQLETPPSDARLLLAGVRGVIEPDGETVADLVSDLLRSVDQAEFLRRLDARGYHHDPAGEDEWLRISLGQIAVWQISHDTPRLHPGLLPAEWRVAITDVRYTLNAAACGEPLPEEDDLWL